MKIAMICPYFAESVGGGDVSTKVFIDELNKRYSNNIKVFVLSNKVNKEYSKYNLVETKFFNFLSSGWRAFLLNTNLFDYYLSLKLVMLFKKIKPNIVHVQEVLWLPAVVKAANRLGIKVINTIRDDRFVCNLATCREDAQLFFGCSNKQYMKCLKKTSKQTFGFGFVGYFLYWFLRFRSQVLLESLKKCDKLVSVSDYVKSNLVKMGVSNDKIMTAYNLIPDWKVNNIEVRKIRQNYGKEKFIIFSSGRIVKNKGFQVLIKSVAEVVNVDHVNKQKDILVLIAGDGGYRQELEKLVSELKVSDYVKFIGKVSHDEIKNYYAISDLVVVPSLIKESLSRVIYDSVGAKKPVIAADVGGNKELFVNNFGAKYKLIFKHSSGLDMKKMIKELHRQKKFYNDYWKKFKDFNQINVNAYFDLYEKLYRKL